jgi:glycosyltransferase involved in cell wall biosynthesis
VHKSRSGHLIEFNVNTETVNKLKQYKEEMGDKFPKFGILVLSYNASEHIKKTLSRIPKEAQELIEEIFIFDDNSPDNTFSVATELKESGLWAGKLNVYKNPTNLRYGGNQKVGYRYAIEKGLDYVIMLHGDGQYAPEYIPDLMLPAVQDGLEVVFASRMINKKDALKGGMPFYKFIGNQVLTRFENLMLGTKLHEFHSGYRMYSTSILKKMPIEENTDQFHFDTEIIIQCRHLGVQIKEVPIKTFYGDEECNVDGIQYAIDVCKAVLAYRFHQLHFIRKGSYIVNRDFIYTRKRSLYGSHEKIIKKIKENSNVLYMGGTNTLLDEELKNKGCSVECIDYVNLDNYDLSRDYDHIILLDVVPRIVNVNEFMQRIQKLLKKDGGIIATIPNIAIWLYRLSLFIGRFNYADKGIVDHSHVRFFTKFTSMQLFLKNGLNIVNVDVTSLPLEVVFSSSGKSRLLKFVDWSYYQLARHWHKLFAYEFIITGEITSYDNASGEGKVI